MDTKGRITRTDEWKPGSWYVPFRYHRTSIPRRLLRVEKPGPGESPFVVFETDSGQECNHYGWRHMWLPVEPPKPKELEKL